ncbi:MAG: hypothetical protein RIS45_1933 [Planctomycetota bacterium]|jgi:hypothetical protein
MNELSTPTMCERLKLALQAKKITPRPGPRDDGFEVELLEEDGDDKMLVDIDDLTPYGEEWTLTLRVSVGVDDGEAAERAAQLVERMTSAEEWKADRDVATLELEEARALLKQLGDTPDLVLQLAAERDGVRRELEEVQSRVDDLEVENGRLLDEAARLRALLGRLVPIVKLHDCEDGGFTARELRTSEVTAERDRMWSAVDQLRNLGESSGDAVERIVSELFETHTLASGRLGERAVDAVARLAKDRTAGYERATAAEAERDRLAEELESERSGEVCGMLADLCDILFEDKERAATHGYEGVVDKAREVVAERDRYKTGCEHYLERAETVRHLMTVGEDVVGTLHRMAGEYVQVSFSRWRWRRMATDGVPHDTERVLLREWLVSDDRAILVAAFSADVVAKVEAS